MLPVVQIRVTGGSGQSKVTFALLDNGSKNSFCSTELVNELRSTDRRTPLSLTSLQGVDGHSSTTVHELVLSNVDGCNAVTVLQITGPCGRCHLALALLTIIKRDRYASAPVVDRQVNGVSLTYKGPNLTVLVSKSILP